MANVIFKPVKFSQRSLSPKTLVDYQVDLVNQLPNTLKKSPAYANIKEMNNQFLISIAIPGFDKSNVEIKLENNILSVNGKIETKRDDKFLRKEFYTSEFSRTFTLPDDINADEISATFTQGILNIFLPKGVKAQPRRIEIL